MRQRTLGVLLKALLAACGVGVGYVNPCHGELYSLQLDSLEAVYGGFMDPSYRATAFDFQQGFTAVHQAWLHVEATPDWFDAPNWVSCWGNLNGVEGPGYFDGVLQPGETLNIDQP